MEREHQWMWLFMLISSRHIQQKGALSGKRIRNIAGLGLFGRGIA